MFALYIFVFFAAAAHLLSFLPAPTETLEAQTAEVESIGETMLIQHMEAVEDARQLASSNLADCRVNKIKCPTRTFVYQKFSGGLYQPRGDVVSGTSHGKVFTYYNGQQASPATIVMGLRKRGSTDTSIGLAHRGVLESGALAKPIEQYRQESYNSSQSNTTEAMYQSILDDRETYPYNTIPNNAPAIITRIVD